MRTSARGMSRAVFSPPQGESANRTHNKPGTLNTFRKAAVREQNTIRRCKYQIYKHRKETKPMLKQQTNQITVVHILRDMFLNPTFRKEKSVCRTQS